MYMYVEVQLISRSLTESGHASVANRVTVLIVAPPASPPGDDEGNVCMHAYINESNLPIPATYS